MLGVLVLVVVMAVYAGLERDVKQRLLGFTPHILMTPSPQSGVEALTEWREAAKRGAKLPHVISARPFVLDNVIVDYQSLQKPVIFNGIDSTDPEQVKSLSALLDPDQPESSADLGLDDNAIISSTLAEAFPQPIKVGSTVRLYSTRNFKEVLQTYKTTENAPVRIHYKDAWEKATVMLAKAWQKSGEFYTLSSTAYRATYPTFSGLHDQVIREQEAKLVDEILSGLDASELDEKADVFRFTAEMKARVENAIQELNATDAEKMDASALKNLKQIVLPREVKVIGIYKSAQNTSTPDLFLPLKLAQNLSGLGDVDAVKGIALRLDDPYLAEQVVAQIKPEMSGTWDFLTWGQEYQALFSLINQQRGMMYFVMSFITLISAFSMMAVMFTVTIQKRREIGVMKALGATSGQIVRVFLYQGLLLGVFGAILGVGAGRFVIHFRGAFQQALRNVGFDPFSNSFTGFTVLPAYNNPAEQLSFALMALVLCSVAALVPAFFAARSDAAKSLRNL